jgi:hypothetical protein
MHVLGARLLALVELDQGISSLKADRLSAVDRSDGLTTLNELYLGGCSDGDVVLSHQAQSLRLQQRHRRGPFDNVYGFDVHLSSLTTLIELHLYDAAKTHLCSTS